MDLTLEEFHQDFMQTIIVDAKSREILKAQAFHERICEDLINSAELTGDYTLAEYTKSNMQVCGYDYDEERGFLTLLGHKFLQDDELKSINLSEIKSSFNKLKTFLTNCGKAEFYASLEETSPAYGMAYAINQLLNQDKIRRIRLTLLTDAKATKNLTEIEQEKHFDVDVEFRVVDINYVYKMYLSAQIGVDYKTEVDFPCLNIVSNETYQSYLAVVRGVDLVEIYERYGQKLFEQNVRTFLQFRGKVNKGLRNTIQYNPDMFFAYNNGITATATDVELDENGHISKITNLQIVNGGQTTSAIYAAHKTAKLDVSKIAVQMKLSVVKKPEEANDFVSKVSEYANTQNKVNPSDFFSNSPFHKEFKKHSQRIRVQAIGSAQIRTHWFYERVRGEFLNEQAYLTKAQKKQFLLENPKNQLLEKTLLAKAEVSWFQKPHVVSKGAQNSTKAFADEVTSMLEKNDLSITEYYFQNSVAKVILFKFIEKLISTATWYNQAYRAQTVAYTMSYLSYLVKKTKKNFNFDAVWEQQAIPGQVEIVLNEIAKTIYEYITTPKENYGNPSQWCKREQCWDEIQALAIDVEINSIMLIDNDENLYIKKNQQAMKSLDNGIDIQTFVVTQAKEVWLELDKYYGRDSNITFTQTEILRKFSNQPILPSAKQAKIIYELYQRALSEGFVFNA